MIYHKVTKGLFSEQVEEQDALPVMPHDEMLSDIPLVLPIGKLE